MKKSWTWTTVIWGKGCSELEEAVGKVNNYNRDLTGSDELTIQCTADVAELFT